MLSAMPDFWQMRTFDEFDGLIQRLWQLTGHTNAHECLARLGPYRLPDRVVLDGNQW